ncbi:MAG: biopolymer transporter ExbD [Bdellovibrionales bacterium]|nr:biopolymer transporter ExbD [Bdellovibrionales bacterium]
MSAGGSEEPNLTPFIDLFSVLVCFLLMTAAWVQLESVSVQVEKAPTPSDLATETAAPPEPPPPKKTKLTVLMTPEKIILLEDLQEMVLPHLGGMWDKDSLLRKLTSWRQKFPDKKDIVLSTEAQVTYGQMIKMYDLLVQSDWPEVGINPN